MQESADLPDWVNYHGPASPGTLCREWFPSAHGLITLSQHAEGRHVAGDAAQRDPPLRVLAQPETERGPDGPQKIAVALDALARVIDKSQAPHEILGVSEGDERVVGYPLLSP